VWLAQVKLLCLHLSSKNTLFRDVKPCGFLRADVSQECNASIIRVTRIGDLGTMLAVTSNRRTLRRNTYVVPSSPILVILIMDRYVPPKRRFLQQLHGVTSQKTAFFIVTAVKTSHLTSVLDIVKGISGLVHVAAEIFSLGIVHIPLALCTCPDSSQQTVMIFGNEVSSFVALHILSILWCNRRT
jgi:hypothetical protein